MPSLIPYFLLTGAVFAAYANIYSVPFLSDDYIWIVHNEFLRDWRNAPSLFVTTVTAGNNIEGSYYRPLHILLYMLVFQLFGLSTAAFHFLNIALHAANSCLVYALGRKLGFKPVAILLASLLWALHPIQTEAVDYINAVVDPLYSFFCLLGALMLLPDLAPRRFLWAVPLMMLGLMSKEAAIIFPLLAMSVIYLKSDRRFDPRTYVRIWPLILTAVGYVVLRFYITSAHGSGTTLFNPASHNSIYGPFAILAHFAGLLVWPAGLHMEHAIPSYADLRHAPVLTGLALIALAFFQIQRNQNRISLPLSWGLFWFAAAYFPTSIIGTRFFEHWIYLPSAGLFLGIGQTLALHLQTLPKQTKKRATQIAIVATIVIACGFAFLTWRQNQTWHDTETFYQNIFKHGESAPDSHVNFGVYYGERGEHEKALEQFRLALKNAHGQLSASSMTALETDLAVTLLKLPNAGSEQEALMHLQRALKIAPDSYVALTALANYYAGRGDEVQAALYRGKADTAHEKITGTQKQPINRKE